MFQSVDAIEVLSGRQTPKENDFSGQVCRKLNMKGVGGSDAHFPSEIGLCWTESESTDVEGLRKDILKGRTVARGRTGGFKYYAASTLRYIGIIGPR